MDNRGTVSRFKVLLWDWFAGLYSGIGTGNADKCTAKGLASSLHCLVSRCDLLCGNFLGTGDRSPTGSANAFRNGPEKQGACLVKVKVKEKEKKRRKGLTQALVLWKSAACSELYRRLWRPRVTSFFFAFLGFGTLRTGTGLQLRSHIRWHCSLTLFLILISFFF